MKHQSHRLSYLVLLQICAGSWNANAMIPHAMEVGVTF